MPTIAEQLLGSVLESSQKAPDLLGAYTKGAELANQAEKIQQQRAELEQKKADARGEKIKEVSGDLLKLGELKLSGKELANYKKWIIAKTVNYKVDDVFTPDSIDLTTSSPENISRFRSLVSDVREGRVSEGEAAQILQDQGAFYDLPPSMLQELNKAGEQRANIVARKENAQLAADAAAGRQQTEIAATGPKAVSADLGKQYAKFSSDGKANIQTKFAKLEEALEKLKNNTVKTGTVRGVTFGNYPTLLAVANPALKSLMDDVRGSINIKEELGDPSPTLQQINQILSRAIDPALPNEENVKKLQFMINELKNSANNKQKEFVKQRFMSDKDAVEFKVTEEKKGFKPNAKQKEIFKKASEEKKKSILSDIMKKFDLSLEQARKLLE